MSKINECCLSVDRIGVANIAKIEQDADLSMLVTGIHALGKGEIKLANYWHDGYSHLYFTSRTGFPLLKARVGIPVGATKKTNSIVVSIAGRGSEYQSDGDELVGSNNVRHILKTLGEVRNNPAARVRRRKRNIASMGNSLADFIERSHRSVARQAGQVFEWTTMSAAFEGLTKLPDCTKELYPAATWALLRVFNGVAAPADITDNTVHFTIDRLYKEMLEKSENARKLREEFLEFWSKPKHILAVLPTAAVSYGAGSYTGVALAQFDFSYYANEIVTLLNNWDPRPRSDASKGPKLCGSDFTYYDKLEDIEESVLSDIKAKCGFIKMFGRSATTLGEDASPLDVRLKSDADGVLPLMRQDTIWKDVNAVMYAATNNLPMSTHWIILDKD